MNRILILAGLALIIAALAACSPGIHTLGNSITFDSNGIVVHAIGHPGAHVNRNGELSIDGKTIAVTATQRELLRRYYQQASDTMSSGAAMGKQGAEMAVHGIGAAIASIFHDGQTPAEKKLDAQSDRIEAAADHLCSDIKALSATQEEIAAEIPAFAPYASGNQMQCEITHTHRKRSGAASSTFTYAVREAPRSDTAAGTPAPPLAAPSSTIAKPSSQP